MARKQIYWIAAAALTLFAVALLWYVPRAAAADKAGLGGECCADLEERIAELEAKSAQKGNRKMSLSVYGQVSETLTYWTEPGFSHRQVMSNGTRDGETYVGFKGEANIAKDTVGGFVLEISAGQFVAGSAFPFSAAVAGGNDTNGVGTRQAYVYLKTALGSVSLGTQQDATWNITGLTGQGVDDLANTSVAHTKLSIRGFNGPGFSEFLDLWDGVRNDSIKYTSPEFYGFSLSATWGDAINVNATSLTGFTNGNIWDVALRFNKDVGEFRAMAAIGYRDGTAIGNLPFGGGFAIQDVKVFSGSAGVQHMPTGLFVNGSYGTLDLTSLAPGSGANGITAWEVQAGDELHISRLGHTTIFAEYGQYDLTHLFGAADKPDFFGLGVVQAIDPAAMSLFLSWQEYQNEKVLASGNVNTFMTGARVKF